MRDETRQYLRLLFDRDDGVCVGEAKAWQPVPRDEVTPGPFVCINPLALDCDRHPEKEWHNTDKPRRADHNVTAYRTWLVECDEESTERQMQMVARAQLPYSAAVHSGGKSVHFLLVAKTPMQSAETYRALGKRLLLGLRCLGIPCDVSCGNPSRLSRLPGVLRGDNPQTLLALNDRVGNIALTDYILGLPTKPEKQRVIRHYTGQWMPPPMWVQRTLQLNLLGPSGSRSQTVFSIALELCYCGWGAEEIYEYLSPLRAWFKENEYGGDRVQTKVQEAVKAAKTNWQGKGV